ncbi:hypothetical protein BYT27DRAFT_7256617 [Phlegmacium glaucopus]|nr:hypothetical protein BYT27DRAFT_7256617 [Phlegmacium glaucopus]
MNVESPTVSERFSNLDAGSQWIFASWAQTEIHRFPGSELELRSASEIFMLPEGLSTETAAHFLDDFVAECGNLRYLNRPKLTFAELEDHPDPPAVLRSLDLLPYKELLKIWITHLPYGHGRPLPMPNSNRDIMPSNVLYAREELLEAAFGSDSVNFLATEFGELESTLYKYGLQGETGLDMTLFTTCAEATHHIGDDVGDRAEQAAVVVVHDMEETMKWLNENVVGFENILYNLQDEDTFLNVNDPPSDPWIWTNANHLVFKTQDKDAIRTLSY